MIWLARDALLWRGDTTGIGRGAHAARHEGQLITARRLISVGDAVAERSTVRKRSATLAIFAVIDLPTTNGTFISFRLTYFFTGKITVELKQIRPLLGHDFVG